MWAVRSRERGVMWRDKGERPPSQALLAPRARGRDETGRLDRIDSRTDEYLIVCSPSIEQVLQILPPMAQNRRDPPRRVALRERQCEPVRRKGVHGDRERRPSPFCPSRVDQNLHGKVLPPTEADQDILEFPAGAIQPLALGLASLISHVQLEELKRWREPMGR